jgi:hypothetical protein
MIKIFVGCAANGEDIESQAVLEHSIRKNTLSEVSITWMQLSRDAASPFFGWRSDWWSTPFSGFRWAVPELCGFQGRAIYTDSDVIFRADVRDLWEMQLEPGKIVIAKGGRHSWRFCVSLWDCERAKKHMLPIAQAKLRPEFHGQMVNAWGRGNNRRFVQAFPENENWNCIDGEDYESIFDARIKAIHYSSEAHQPQLRHAVPRLAKDSRTHWFDGQIKRHWRPELEALFDEELADAIKWGRDPAKYQPTAMFGNYVKKSEKNYRSHEWAR